MTTSISRLPLLTNGSAPFRGLDDEWVPPCSGHDSRLWTNPRDRADVREAAQTCHHDCERRVECYAAGRQRSEWGVWGGVLLVAGTPAKKFRQTVWLEDRHLDTEEKQEVAAAAARMRMRHMLAPHLDTCHLTDESLPGWLQAAEA